MTDSRVPIKVSATCRVKKCIYYIALNAFILYTVLISRSALSNSDYTLVIISDRPYPIVLRHIYSSLNRRVAFYYPAYDSIRLFEIPVYNSLNDGIHYRTALLIYGIIISNV